MGCIMTVWLHYDCTVWLWWTLWFLRWHVFSQPTPGSKRSDSRDRPGSVRSTHGTGGKKGKSANTKKVTWRSAIKFVWCIGFFLGGGVLFVYFLWVFSFCWFCITFWCFFLWILFLMDIIFGGFLWLLFLKLIMFGEFW